MFLALVLELGELSQGVCGRNEFIQWWIIARPDNIWQVPLIVRVGYYVRGEHTVEHVRAEQTVNNVHVNGI